MKPLLVKLLALTVLPATMAAAAAPVPAALPSAQARTLGFGYDLIDLNQLDGIAPTISFRYDGDAWQHYLEQRPDGPLSSQMRDGYGVLAAGGGAATATLSSAPDQVGANVAATDAPVLASGHASTTMTFSLTPHTAVIFHVPYTLLAGPSAPGTVALASLGFSGVLGGGYDSFAVSVEQDVAGTQYGSLTAELAAGGSGMFGALRLDAYALAAVPEPATYLMLLAGCAVVGCGAWRQRRRH